MHNSAQQRKKLGFASGVKRMLQEKAAAFSYWSGDVTRRKLLKLRSDKDSANACKFRGLQEAGTSACVDCRLFWPAVLECSYLQYRDWKRDLSIRCIIDVI